MKKRIWELDAARGLCILGMVLVHIIYDLQNMLHLSFLANSGLFDFVSQWGGVLFFLISGCSATLGSRSVRRGLTVLICGVIVSAVTWIMYALGFAGKGLVIYFGVLHCLGVSMLLWPLFRKMPPWLLALCAAVLIAAGLAIPNRGFDTGYWLMPLGFPPYGFITSDYFPLLPFVGFFLLGGVIGKLVYPNKQTRFPNVREDRHPIRFLCLLGKWSLPIYMLHQPVITGILSLLEALL